MRLTTPKEQGGTSRQNKVTQRYPRNAANYRVMHHQTDHLWPEVKDRIEFYLTVRSRTPDHSHRTHAHRAETVRDLGAHRDQATRGIPLNHRHHIHQDLIAEAAPDHIMTMTVTPVRVVTLLTVSVNTTPARTDQGNPDVRKERSARLTDFVHFYWA